ncbi:MAG: hypothetical protein IPM55_13470 [Acidobacteria bacterium]|nr:hypothetical protein [Acidobacteriota bacterium]
MWFSDPAGHSCHFIDRTGYGPVGPRAEAAGTVVIFFVGRLEEIKARQKLIRIWDRVEDCDLLVAGTGTLWQSASRSLWLRATKAEQSFSAAMQKGARGFIRSYALLRLSPSSTYETFWYHHH